MAIQEPNDTPAIQLTRPFWFYASVVWQICHSMP